jgi:hypothetical protein
MLLLRVQAHKPGLSCRFMAANYESSVLQFVQSQGFSGSFKGPVETQQAGCSYYLMGEATKANLRTTVRSA